VLIIEEVQRLKHNANNWIEETTRQQSLFPQAVELPVVQLNQLQYVGFRYGLLYESLYEVFKRFNFHWLRNKLLLDLVIARIAQPSSKLRSIEFLKEFFGVEHGRRELYRQIPIILKTRNTIESMILEIAKKEFAFNFSVVFYDVTTLYFESFQEDELRRSGFSKDNKFTQPQILLGLLVSGEGFPVGYQIFEGKKFEGHTLIPIILRFKRKHKIERLTVVAAAAMISIENIKALTKVHLNYIVGARAANLPVIGVNVSRPAIKRKRFANLRAELYWKIRDSLRLGILSLPDDDLLAGDLTSIKYSFDHLGRVALENKEKTKNRINRSPDTGDALALSYAGTFNIEEMDDDDTDDRKERLALRAESKWTVPGRDTSTVSRWSVGNNGKRRFGKGQ